VTARQRTTLRGEGGNAFDRAMALIVIGGIGRVWLALWLAVYPRSRAVVRWTYHDELMAVDGRARWKRALQFMMQLPRFAASQSEAESEPSTQTNGEPPDIGNLPSGAGAGAGLVDLAGRLVRYLVMTVFALVAVVMWINVIGDMAEMLDDFGRATFSEVVALALILVVAMAPIALIHQRRWFRWTRPESHVGESPAAHAVWRVAVVLFGAVALLIWSMVMGDYFEVLDRLRPTAALSDTAAKALMVLIASAPLAYVVRRRHWVDPDGATPAAV
jgi:hypothetical protein